MPFNILLVFSLFQI